MKKRSEGGLFSHSKPRRGFVRGRILPHRLPTRLTDTTHINLLTIWINHFLQKLI